MLLFIGVVLSIVPVLVIVSADVIRDKNRGGYE
jgi:hypothetical protein